MAVAAKSRTIGFYAQHIKPQIKPEYLEPNFLRLGFIFAYLALSIGSIWLIAQPSTTLPMRVGLSLVIGWSFGSFGFLAHELLHGSIIRNSFWQTAIAWLMMVPYFI